MKKHEFYIFYSEDEKEQVPFKLVKTYINRFCIDEEDQSEIIGRVIHDNLGLKMLQIRSHLKSWHVLDAQCVLSINRFWWL